MVIFNVQKACNVLIQLFSGDRFNFSRCDINYVVNRVLKVATKWLKGNTILLNLRTPNCTIIISNVAIGNNAFGDGSITEVVDCFKSNYNEINFKEYV